MKKIIFLLTILILASCSTPGRVCGASSGKTCIKNNPATTPNKVVNS